MAKAVGQILIELSATSAKLQSEFRKATGLLTQFQRDTQKVARIVETAFAFKIGNEFFNGIKSLGSALNDLAQEGEKARAIKEGFEQLGGASSSIELASKRIHDLVDDTDLMAIAAKGLAAGIPNLNKGFADIAELGARAAKTLNTDVKGSIEAITEAISKGKAKGTLQQLGFEFTNTGSKATVMKEAMQQLPKVIERFAPISDNVATAFTKLGVVFGDVKESIGLVLIDSPELTKALDDLAEAVKKVDWEEFGRGIAAMSTEVVNALKEVTPWIASFVEKVGIAAQIAAKLPKTLAANVGVGDLANPAALGFNVGKAIGDAAGLAGQDKLKGLLTSIKEAVGKDFAGMFGLGGKKDPPKVNLDLSRQISEAKKNAQEIAKQNEALNKELAKRNADEVKGQMTSALKAGNFEGARDLLDKYKATISTLVDEQLKQYGLADSERVGELREMMINDYLDPMIEQEGEARRQMFQESVDFFRDIFTQAIEGGTFDFKKLLQDVAIGFAAELAGSITSSLGLNLGILKNPMDLGGAIFSSISGGGGGAGGSLLGGAVGGGLVGGGLSSIIGSFGVSGATAASARMVGPLTAGGMFTPATGMLGALGPWGAAALGAGAIFGMGGGKKLLGGLGGIFGGESKDPDTIARKKISGFIGDKIPGFGFTTGGSSFKPGGGAWDTLKGLDGDTQSGFSAIGTSLKSVLGIAEDVGPQIAAVFADKVGGSLEKARELMDQLGFSAEDMKAEVIKAGVAAGKSWLQIQGEIQGIDKLFGAAGGKVTELKTAVDGFVQSNNQGVAALENLKNIGVASAAQGAKTLADMEKKLVAVWAPNQVGLFMKALADLGIKSLDQLKNASDATLIALAAHLQALGLAFGDVANNANTATQSVNKLGQATGDIKTGGAQSVTEKIVPHARGGVIDARMRFQMSGGRIGLVGEAGPEAILPLTRIGGVLGVRAVGGGGGGQGGLTVVVNAPGAAPGAEIAISRAIYSIEQRVFERTVSAVNDLARRGTL